MSCSLACRRERDWSLSHRRPGTPADDLWSMRCIRVNVQGRRARNLIGTRGAAPAIILLDSGRV
jgi:hypothetical protein